MALTVASGTLDTAWQEFSTVSFTTGTLATLSACLTEVEAKIQRGTLSATTTPKNTDVNRWLIRAKQELAEVKNFTFKRRYAFANTASATFRYSMPPDYNGGDVGLHDVTNNREIVVWPNRHFDLKFPDPSEETSNEPLIATIKGMELWLSPPAGGAYEMRLEYGRSGADETAIDFSWLPEPERFRCCDYAIHESFLTLQMWSAARVYKDKWNEGLSKAVRSDGRRKWATAKYQAIDAFQEYSAYNNQG